VPARAAVLDAEEQLTLEDASHYTGFGRPWCGSREAVPSWGQRLEVDGK